MLNLTNKLILTVIVALTGNSAIAKQSQLPGFFVENHGQAAPDIRFIMRRPNGMAYFANNGLTISLAKRSLGINFLNCSPNVILETRENLRAVANFFQGNDSINWRSDVKLFKQLVYRDLWPGVDVIYGTSTAGFKSEFRLAPGAHPAAVRWNYGPDAQIGKDGDGTLIVRMGDEIVREAAPVIYQNILGTRVAVKGEYTIESGGQVGFHVGNYDNTYELVIDPEIVFTSFLGGSGQDAATSVTTDAYGNIIIAGYTSSTTFPTTSTSFQPRLGGSVDAFVAKFNGDGTTLLFCTFLGGMVMIALWLLRLIVSETSI